MGLRSALASLTRSAADDRLAAAWADAASPVVATPFGPGSGSDQPPGHAPPIDWTTEGMPPSPTHFNYTPDYSGHTFKAQAAPIGFEGWGLQRIRSAIAMHRLGIFWESSLLMVSLLGFAPVLAALGQAVAPIADLDRYIRLGSTGASGKRPVGPLAKYLRDYLEEALVPRAGLLPSPYLEPSLWITMMIYMRMMGFCVLQHVDGEPDPETEVRPRYTRVFPPWAVKYERTLGKWYAYTSEGVVEIKNDGKFTLVCDEQEPHFTGAIVAISEEVLSGRLIQQLRNSWFFKYGNPKWVAIMPEKVATMGPAGDAFFAALQTITGPDGIGALPYGSTFKTEGLDSKASDSFGAGLQSVILHIAMVIVGGTGTGIDGSESTGEGYYKPQKGGGWTVLDHFIRRPLKCIVRAINGYHIAPHLDINWGNEIAAAKRAGTWSNPSFDIPFPRPEAEAQMQALGARYKLALEIVGMAYDDDIAVTAEFLDALSKRLELDPPLTLGSIQGARILAWHVEQKAVAIDELRKTLGQDPLPNGAGSVERLAEERLAGKDKAGAKASQGDPLIDGKPDTVPEDAEPAAAGGGGGGDATGGDVGGSRKDGEPGGHQGS